MSNNVFEASRFDMPLFECEKYKNVIDAGMRIDRSKSQFLVHYIQNFEFKKNKILTLNAKFKYDRPNIDPWTHQNVIGDHC